MSRAAVAIAQRDELVGTWGLKIDVIRKIPGNIWRDGKGKHLGAASLTRTGILVGIDANNESKIK